MAVSCCKQGTEAQIQACPVYQQGGRFYRQAYQQIREQNKLAADFHAHQPAQAHSQCSNQWSQACPERKLGHSRGSAEMNFGSMPTSEHQKAQPSCAPSASVSPAGQDHATLLHCQNVRHRISALTCALPASPSPSSTPSQVGQLGSQKGCRCNPPPIRVPRRFSRLAFAR